MNTVKSHRKTSQRMADGPMAINSLVADRTPTIQTKVQTCPAPPRHQDQRQLLDPPPKQEKAWKKHGSEVPPPRSKPKKNPNMRTSHIEATT